MLLEKNLVVDFTDSEIQIKPFHYLILPKAFEPEDSLSILKWLETDAPWKLVETDFYEQFEFDVLDVELPNQLAFLYERDFLDYLIKQVESLFSVNLTDKVDLTAHKLISGQTIRLHNDYIPNQETHRLLIQLNRDWKEENGGFLLFFNSSDPKDIHRIIRPVHNSLAGFEISPDSNHAVSTIHSGERYTLVYSLYAENSNN
jgi:Rps23 Pro-64 3,4-dihydroxylase Tpa1-like proline 4-hydroxylase